MNVLREVSVRNNINMNNFRCKKKKNPNKTFSGCGTELELGYVKMVDGSHGDWETISVSWKTQSSSRNYIWVSPQGGGDEV